MFLSVRCSINKITHPPPLASHHVCQPLTLRLEVPQFCHICKLNHYDTLAHVTVRFRRVPFLLSCLDPRAHLVKALSSWVLDFLYIKHKVYSKKHLYRNEGCMELEPALNYGFLWRTSISILITWDTPRHTQWWGCVAGSALQSDEWLVHGIARGMWVLVGSLFMFSNFYWLDLHNKTRVALAKLWWNIYKNWTEDSTSLDLAVVTGSACLLIS